jgi:hypothetical protein
MALASLLVNATRHSDIIDSVGIDDLDDDRQTDMAAGWVDHAVRAIAFTSCRWRRPMNHLPDSCRGGADVIVSATRPRGRVTSCPADLLLRTSQELIGGG